VCGVVEGVQGVGSKVWFGESSMTAGLTSNFFYFFYFLPRGAPPVDCHIPV
jgi:hypothetical protein